MAELRKFLDELYNKSGGKTERLDHLTDDEILRDGAATSPSGVPFATPVFDGAAEEEIRGDAEARLSGRHRQGQGPDRDAHPGDAARRPHRRCRSSVRSRSATCTC